VTPLPESQRAEHTVVTLSRAEAIVLFELLSRFSEADRLELEDPAERQVLWSICCLLEKELLEPLDPNYHEVLLKARAAVRAEDR
jgi:hypothetical protein